MMKGVQTAITGVMVFLALITFSTVRADAAMKHKDIIKLKGTSAYCLECHTEETPRIFEEWVNSAHGKAGVGCADCHESSKGNDDSFFHAERFYVQTVVTTFTCAKCHKDQMRDYFTSGHAKSLELLKTMKEDDPRYPIVSQYKDDDFRQCGGCHGVEVKVDKDGKPDPATWPNSGAGRINPDKGHGSCATCHPGHLFSMATARQPETCLRCHDGANYPEGEIYRSSLHGILYETQGDKAVLERPGLYLDGKTIGYPTCAYCHFNGAGKGLLNRHNAAWRLPRDLTGPEANMAPKRAEKLRNNMKSVCNQCHASSVIDRFFDEADKQLHIYQQDVMTPGLADYKKRLESTEGDERQALLQAYNNFLVEGKRYRMTLYMGHHERVQR
jgi:hydroxylamine dehydrogenase